MTPRTKVKVVARVSGHGFKIGQEAILVEWFQPRGEVELLPHGKFYGIGPDEFSDEDNAVWFLRESEFEVVEEA